MSIKTELLALMQASSDGLLHVESAEEWARNNPDSALHKSLTWNDAIAAREYRYDQLRSLIRLHIVTADDTPMVVSLSYDRTKGGGYRAVDDVLKSRDLSAIMLADALAELDRVKTKYQRIEQLTSVWKQVEQVRSRSRRSRKEATAENHAAGSSRPGPASPT